MNKRPQFSVILPTYNRADTLPLAIKSILNQSFEDFELVISNGGSSDNTSDVVRAFDDNRIHYVETKERLNMQENYEFAVNQAKGEYIIFFSDDDAFVPSMLDKVNRVITETSSQIVVFPIAYYYPDDYRDQKESVKKNSLLIPHFSKQIKRVESSKAVKRMCSASFLIKEAIDPDYVYPLIGNVACHKSIFDKFRAKKRKFFATIPVDIYFMTMTLGMINEYYMIDEPLLVWSKWSKNSSIDIKTKDKSLRQHYEKLLDGESLDYLPLKFPLPMNCYANAVLKAIDNIGKDKFNYIKVNWVWYFFKMREYLLSLDKEGVDVKDELQEFNNAVAKLPKEIKKSVEDKIIKDKFALKKFSRIYTPFITRTLKQILGQHIPEKPIIIHGDEKGFYNFREAAVFLENDY